MEAAKEDKKEQVMGWHDQEGTGSSAEGKGQCAEGIESQLGARTGAAIDELRAPGMCCGKVGENELKGREPPLKGVRLG
ncbi:hypothetical protein CDL15_Pgr023724 [Punica granatum]|uniref:Uncharacterized protein n=1 Tax=Punica granatum TaxID=22663 RepID=A0A218WRE4_PUNGR|nr:hypothetical protein CDL15_Pgr023724 [Punica granatum]